MRRLDNLILLGIMLISLTFIGCPKPTGLVGQWASVRGDTGIFTFNYDGTFVVIEERGANSREEVGRYETDFSKNPAWIDLVGNNSSGQLMRREGLIKFNNENEIAIEFFPMGGPGRPANFSNNVMIFKRLE
jgi:hypothetical protein